MKPEDKSRQIIDIKLIESGWLIQDMSSLNLTASLGVAIREFSTSTGSVDYALFIEGVQRNNRIGFIMLGIGMFLAIGLGVAGLIL